MALYRARWICPSTGRPKYRLFHSKKLAEAFRALPRSHTVDIRDEEREPA